jgi:hypothetical protein
MAQRPVTEGQFTAFFFMSDLLAPVFPLRAVVSRPPINLTEED